MEAFAEVDVDGAIEISTPWKPTSTQMSADGPCFASYLASVRNSSLVFGDGDLRPVVPGSSDVWLPEPVRVWVGGVWLTDIRDAEVLYIPCSVCKKKVSELGECPNSACAGGAAETRAVLTTVTLADATGCLYQVLIRTEEFLVFTGMQTVADLEACLTSEGHVSLPFRCRADVILGAQKTTQHGNPQTLSPHVAAFEVLRVTPVLLAEWDTPQRPLPEYVFQINEARNVHCVFDHLFFTELSLRFLDFGTVALRPCSAMFYWWHPSTSLCKCLVACATLQLGPLQIRFACWSWPRRSQLRNPFRVSFVLGTRWCFRVAIPRALVLSWRLFAPWQICLLTTWVMASRAMLSAP